MIAERPELRQRRASGQIGIIFYYPAHGIAADKVVIEISGICTEKAIVLTFLCHIKEGLEGIIKKQSVNAGITQCDKKRHRFVKRLKRVSMRLRQI